MNTQVTKPKLLIATSNPGKMREYAALLRGAARSSALTCGRWRSWSTTGAARAGPPKRTPRGTKAAPASGTRALPRG